MTATPSDSSNPLPASADPVQQPAPDTSVAQPVSLQRLGLADPFRWLAKGLQDVRAAPGIAMFYGVCFWCMALCPSSVINMRAPGLR